MLTACKQVTHEVQDVIVADAAQQIPLMKAAASLLLRGLQVLIKSHISETEETRYQSLEELVDLLLRWIRNKAGASLGLPSTKQQRKLKEELKVYLKNYI